MTLSAERNRLPCIVAEFQENSPKGHFIILREEQEGLFVDESSRSRVRVGVLYVADNAIHTLSNNLKAKFPENEGLLVSFDDNFKADFVKKSDIEDINSI